MISLEQFKALIGDLARPYAIVAGATSASIATVIVAWKVDGFEAAGIFIGAVWAGVGALYGAKAFEVAAVRKRDSEVEIAKAAKGAADEGELAADDRVKL